MKHSLLRIFSAIAIISVLAFSGNPPNGRTGAPGDGLCSDCHSSGAQSGSVMVSGLPATIMPGQTYTLTVTSTTASNSDLGGFQMVGLHDDGNINAGSMSNASPSSTITVVGSGRSYHEHNPAQAFGGGSTVSWMVDWTAPTTGPDGDITFYAASVLANGNGNNQGDGVVTTNVSGSFTGLIPLTANITSSSPVTCNGGTDGSATVNASGGQMPYSYLWSNGETNATAIMLSAGSQSVTVTDDGGQMAVDQVTISEPSALVLTTTIDNHITCNGNNDGQATASASGGSPGYTFNWSNGQSSATATGLTPGMHSVTVTDVNNCSTSADITITEPDVLVLQLIFQTNISCFGFNDGTAAVQASGGSNPYSFSWSNGQTGGTAVNLTPGSHSVTVTDVNNCTADLEIFILEPVELAISLLTQQNVSCFGGNDGSASVTASGGTGGYTFLWSDGQMGQTANNLVAMAYTCMVTDANGCEDIVAVNISQPMELTIDLVITDESMPGANDGSIDADVTGGMPPYMYDWSNGASGEIITGLIPGDYSVTVTDDNGCTISAMGTVQGMGCDLSVSIVVVQDLACPDDMDGSLTYQANQTINQVLWSTGSTTDTISGLSGNVYSITVTDDNNCEASSTFTLSGNDMEAPMFVFDTLCLFIDENGSAELDSQTFYENIIDNCDPNPTALFGPLTFDCDSVGTIIDNFVLRDASGNINTVTLYLYIADTISPTITCPADITVNTCDTINYTTPVGIDNCDSVSIELISGIGSGNIFPVGTSIEQYRAVDQYGNQVVCSFSVTVISDLDVNVMTQDASCFGATDGSVSITGIGGSPPYSFVVDPINDILSLPAGNYQVTLEDSEDCVVMDTFQINEPEAMELDSLVITDATAGNFDGSISIHVIGGTPPYSFLWFRDTTMYSTQEDLINLFAGYYSVVITDDNDCQITFDSIMVDETVATEDKSDIIDQIKIFESDKRIYVKASSEVGPYQLHLYNNRGQLCGRFNDLFLDVEIDLERFSDGYYILHLLTQKGQMRSQGMILR